MGRSKRSNFSIESMSIEDTSVITDINIGTDSIGIKEVSPGISSTEVIIESGGCQYKAWFKVEVKPIQIIATDPVFIPEGDHTGIGVKLSNSPPVAQTVMLTALVAGDSDISIVSGQTMTFDASNWDTEQYMIVEAAEDDLDVVNGDAIITILADHDFYIAAIIGVFEIDNDCSDSKGAVTITDAVAEVSSIQIGVTKIDVDENWGLNKMLFHRIWVIDYSNYRYQS
jgi:hypothetical protein